MKVLDILKICFGIYNWYPYSVNFTLRKSIVNSRVYFFYSILSLIPLDYLFIYLVILWSYKIVLDACCIIYEIFNKLDVICAVFVRFHHLSNSIFFMLEGSKSWIIWLLAYWWFGSTKIFVIHIGVIICFLLCFIFKKVRKYIYIFV